MAIFESVIFQRMRKSVGNITTYEAGGKQVLRQNPLQRKDKKSEPQLKHRDRMRTLKKICGYAIALSTRWAFALRPGRQHGTVLCKPTSCGRAWGADWQSRQIGLTFVLREGRCMRL